MMSQPDQDAPPADSADPQLVQIACFMESGMIAIGGLLNIVHGGPLEREANREVAQAVLDQMRNALCTPPPPKT
jgi:hypothetical protein